MFEARNEYAGRLADIVYGDRDKANLIDPLAPQYLGKGRTHPISSPNNKKRLFQSYECDENLPPTEARAENEYFSKPNEFDDMEFEIIQREDAEMEIEEPPTVPLQIYQIDPVQSLKRVEIEYDCFRRNIAPENCQEEIDIKKTLEESMSEQPTIEMNEQVLQNPQTIIHSILELEPKVIINSEIPLQFESMVNEETTGQEPQVEQSNECINQDEMELDTPSLTIIQTEKEFVAENTCLLNYRPDISSLCNKLHISENQIPTIDNESSTLIIETSQLKHEDSKATHQEPQQHQLPRVEFTETRVELQEEALMEIEQENTVQDKIEASAEDQQDCPEPEEDLMNQDEEVDRSQTCQEDSQDQQEQEQQEEELEQPEDELIEFQQEQEVEKEGDVILEENNDEDQEMIQELQEEEIESQQFDQPQELEEDCKDNQNNQIIKQVSLSESRTEKNESLKLLEKQKDVIQKSRVSISKRKPLYKENKTPLNPQRDLTQKKKIFVASKPRVPLYEPHSNSKRSSKSSTPSVKRSIVKTSGQVKPFKKPLSSAQVPASLKKKSVIVSTIKSAKSIAGYKPPLPSFKHPVLPGGVAGKDQSKLPKKPPVPKFNFLKKPKKAFN